MWKEAVSMEGECRPLSYMRNHSRALCMILQGRTNNIMN